MPVYLNIFNYVAMRVIRTSDDPDGGASVGAVRSVAVGFVAGVFVGEQLMLLGVLLLLLGTLLLPLRFFL